MDDLEKMETTDGQANVMSSVRERLNAFVLPSVARQVKIAAATRGITLGEVIDEIVAAALPPAPGPEAAR